MGFFEIVFLSLLALILIGPKELPSLAKALISLINELKRVASDVSKPLNLLKEKEIQIPLTKAQKEEKEDAKQSPLSNKKKTPYESEQARRKTTKPH